jgi:hypothetical protein
MRALKAHVKSGRLLLNEPTDLPDGSQVELMPVDVDELDDAERAALHASIEESEADFEAGRVVSEEELWARLKALR